MPLAAAGHALQASPPVPHQSPRRWSCSDADCNSHSPLVVAWSAQLRPLALGPPWGLKLPKSVLGSARQISRVLPSSFVRSQFLLISGSATAEISRDFVSCQVPRCRLGYKRISRELYLKFLKTAFRNAWRFGDLNNLLL